MRGAKGRGRDWRFDDYPVYVATHRHGSGEVKRVLRHLSLTVATTTEGMHSRHNRNSRFYLYQKCGRYWGEYMRLREKCNDDTGNAEREREEQARKQRRESALVRCGYRAPNLGPSESARSCNITCCPLPLRPWIVPQGVLPNYNKPEYQ